MLDNYTEDVELLITWYERAKEVTIEAESLDTGSGTFIQPLHEQRYCLDHFIRAITYAEDGEAEEKVKKAISSAIGHLQRDYSDSVEWMQVSVMEEYTSFLSPFTSEEINKGFPEYYSKVRIELDKIRDLVNAYKKNKSIEKASEVITDEEANKLTRITDQILAENVVIKLKEHLKLLHERQSVLLEIQERDRREEKKATIKDKIMLPIITGAAGAIIAAIVTACILL